MLKCVVQDHLLVVRTDFLVFCISMVHNKIEQIKQYSVSCDCNIV